MIINAQVRRWLLNPAFDRMKHEVASLLPHHFGFSVPQIDTINKIAQINLMMKFREMQGRGMALPSFADVEFSAFSQNGEDGILLYIFALIGVNSRKSVELCAGDGIECNSANLIINHGFYGLLIDGDEHNIRRGTEFYTSHKATRIWPPKLISSWVTRDNVNALVASNGFAGELDLFSLDMDGVDYWIWDAIDCITPRVVVVEYQDIWGPDRAMTVPYTDNFRAVHGPDGPDYAGASLAAFVKLARRKGYRLVGCQALGFNAFFIRDGVGEEVFPEIAPAECFGHPKNRFGMEQRLPRVQHRPWVEV